MFIEATDVFKKQEERANFIKIQTEQRDDANAPVVAAIGGELFYAFGLFQFAVQT